MNKSITRRILAIIFGATGALVLGYLALMGDKEALIALISLVGMVLGFYFGVANKA